MWETDKQTMRERLRKSKRQKERETEIDRERKLDYKLNRLRLYQSTNRIESINRLLNCQDTQKVMLDPIYNLFILLLLS